MSIPLLVPLSWVGLAAIGGLSAPAGPPPAGTDASVAEQWLTHVPREGVAWDEAPLRDVVAWLGDEDRTGAPVHMNIVVNWRALEDVGVDADSEVSLHLAEVPLARILSLVLEQFEPQAKLGYEIEGNVLRLATEALLEGRLTIRTYDVAGVLARDPDFMEAPIIRMALQERTSSRRGGTAGGAGGPFEGGDQKDRSPTRAERVESLIQAIRQIVEPESWAPEGRGAIAAVGSTLVVRNSLAAQEQIASLLERLSR